MFDNLIPHPPIHLSEVRPWDIWFLLAVGIGWECCSRLVLLSYKVKPQSLREKEIGLQLLQLETKRMQGLGPSKFVETSKLERQVLAMEKENTSIRSIRKHGEQQVEKYLIRYGTYVVTFLIFVLYYGVPILTLGVASMKTSSMGDDDDVFRQLQEESFSSRFRFSSSAAARPPPTFDTLFFPMSYFGMGLRIARFGLVDASNAVGALVVLWSGHVFAEKIMDGVFAFFLLQQ